MKYKIYFLLTTIQIPKPNAGDKINEIKLMTCISKFADVYYNDQLFDPSKEDYGIIKKPIKIPKRKYDLYYVRNNAKIFKILPNPKIWVGSPYHVQCFKDADAIITFTDSWKYKLINHNKGIIPIDKLCSLYKDQIIQPKKVITFHQSFDECFKPGLRNTKKCKDIRNKFGGDFIIGHFGRVSKACYPYSLLVILPSLYEKYKNINIKIIYCGLKSQNKLQINSDYIDFFPGFSRIDMPYAISACDLILSNYRHQTAHYGGSQHVLEAMACGIPILTGDFDVRKEQLGEDYELFWKYIPNGNRATIKAEKQMLDHISNIIENPEYGKKIAKKLIKRSKYYTMAENSKRLKKDIVEFIVDFNK